MADEKDHDGTPVDGNRGGGDDGDKPESQFYVGSYKTKDDAEKGFREKESYIAKLKSEHDKAQAQLERMQQEVLGKLTDAATRRASEAPAKTKAEKAAEIEKLREEMRSDAGNAVDLFNSWLNETETSLTAKVEAQLKKLADSIEEQNARLVTLSPEYQRNKELVERLQKKGLPLQQAIDIAKELAPVSEPALSDKSAPSGTTGGSAAAGGGGTERKGVPSELLVMLSKMVPGGLTEAERKRLARGV